MNQASHSRQLRPIDLFILAIILMLFPTACSCWPSLPALVHQDGCGRPQYAAAGPGKQAVPLPPKMFVAYSHGGDIWIMDNDGKNKKRLTSDPAREFGLSASYQKERIWFIRAAGDTPETMRYGDVYSCDYGGQDLKQVTKGLKVKFAVVSPDGKRLAISVATVMPDASGTGNIGETADMWVVDAAGIKLSMSSIHDNLTGDLRTSAIGGREGSTYAAWSPATMKIAFTYKPDTSSSLGISTKVVYLANSDGTERKILVTGADQPSFDGYGTSVAVTTGARSDTMGVGRVNATGGALADVLPVSSAAPLCNTYDPIFITTYEEIKEWPTVIYGKTTYPAAPAQPVNTLEKYRIDGAKTTVLVSQEGTENVISHVACDNSYQMIFLQIGKSVGLDVDNTTIWSVKPDGTGLKMLSQALNDGDSEPTAAVSYNWSYKGKNGGANFYATCHWPYQK